MKHWSTLFLFFYNFASFAGVTQHFEIYGARSAQDLKLLKSWGFTQLILDSPHLMELADKEGIRVVQANWFHRKTPWESVQKSIDFASQLKNLVSVNLMDEPIFHGGTEYPPQYYFELRTKIKAQHPDMPLSITEYGPSPEWPKSKIDSFKLYLNSVDKIRIDPYPVLKGRPLNDVYRWHKLTKDLVGERPISITNILQTWTLTPETPRLPTISQLRVMAYEAILMEAEALSFFDYNPAIWGKVPGFTDGFVGLLQELIEFSTRFQSCRVNTTMDTFSTVKSQISCPLSATPYTVLVNTQPRSVNGLKAHEIRIDL